MTTVLIAAPEYLPALKLRPELGEIIAFADADVLQALEAITSLHPNVVALEKQFADTSRGSALINRIKADPTLKECEVRLVLHDGGETVVGQEDTTKVSSTPVAPINPLDFHGTRRAERFSVAQGVDVQLEGNAVRLVNISLFGAQVLSPTILRPNQRVRFALTAQPGATRFKSIVAWASFEIPMGVARYRAGIEFLEGAESPVLGKFIKKHKI